MIRYTSLKALLLLPLFTLPDTSVLLSASTSLLSPFSLFRPLSSPPPRPTAKQEKTKPPPRKSYLTVLAKLGPLRCLQVGAFHKMVRSFAVILLVQPSI